MNTAFGDRHLHVRDMQSRTELVAQLAHVGGQLAAPKAEAAREPLLDELQDIAGALDVPINRRRDDAHVFLENPEKIAEATWTQCGGVLYELRHGAGPERPADPPPALSIAAEVAQRIARLAATQR